MRIIILITAILFLFLVFYYQEVSSSVDEIQLPNGCKIEEFASNLGSPRFMAFNPNGVLFVTISDKGEVLALPDNDKDGKADTKITFAKDFNHPHGIAFYKDYLYIGETNQGIRFKYKGFDSPPGAKLRSPLST